jgi:hypothetical protein
MEILSNLSDDQIALLGCATALVITGSLMCVSYFIGRGQTQHAGSKAPLTAVAQRPEAAIAGAAEDAEHRSAA